jgi:hypothetical protein
VPSTSLPTFASVRVCVSLLFFLALLTCGGGVDKIPDVHETGPCDEEPLNDDIVFAVTVTVIGSLRETAFIVEAGFTGG